MNTDKNVFAQQSIANQDMDSHFQNIVTLTSHKDGHTKCNITTFPFGARPGHHFHSGNPPCYLESNLMLAY